MVWLIASLQKFIIEPAKGDDLPYPVIKPAKEKSTFYRTRGCVIPNCYLWLPY